MSAEREGSSQGRSAFQKRLAAGALGRGSALEWFFNNAPLGFCVLDLDLRFVQINGVLADINGLPAEAHIGRPVADVVPALYAGVREVTAKILETGAPVLDHEFSGETQARPGVMRHWLESWHPLIDEKAAIVGFAVIVEEITATRKAEDALKQLVDRYELVLEGAGDAIWDWDVLNRRVSFSSRWKELHGYGADEDIGDSEDLWLSSIHPDDLSKVMESLAAHLEGRTPIFVEDYRIRCRDGAEKWVHDRGLAIRDKDGLVVRMAGSEQDITGRKLVEKALVESREDFRRAQEVGQIGWWRLDIRKDVLKWSDENYRIFGVPLGQPLTYDTFLSLVHPDDRDHVGERWSAAVRGEPYDIDHRIVSKNAIKWVREKAYLEFDDAGELLGGFGITQDITSRKRIEEDLREADRRKDEFITMLAHELRNPLAPLRAGLYVLGKSEPVSPSDRRMQEIMERQVDHLISLVDDLLDISRFSRGTVRLKKEVLDIGKLVGQVVDGRSTVFQGKECRLTANLPDHPLLVDADPVRMTQILTNLLDNANKYSPDNADIEVSLANGGGCAVISVKDRGIGIPPDMLARIFEPFVQVDANQFEARRGLGLGLALVRSLVELHDGRIEAQSEGRGRGSEFVVRIPLWSS